MFPKPRQRRRASLIIWGEMSMAVIAPTNGAKADSMRPIPQPISSEMQNELHERDLTGNFAGQITGERDAQLRRAHCIEGFRQHRRLSVRTIFRWSTAPHEYL
jgi:hypothetical protein